MSTPAAEEDAIFGSYELRDTTPALRVEVGGIFDDGVRERDDEEDE
jgi:hypothetical protein